MKKMKVALISSFPLMDRLSYKKVFLSGIASRESWLEDCILVYGQSGLIDYYREARRREAVFESLKRLSRKRSAGSENESSALSRQDIPEGSLEKFARMVGISVKKYHKLRDRECVAFLNEFKPHVIHNLSGLYIPGAILDIPTCGVIGGHYGLLPLIRGQDTIRWSILLDVPLFVSHMFLVRALDRGDIISRQKVEVRHGDRVEDLRFKCQILNALGQLELLDRLREGDVKRIRQERSEGSYFYTMGKILRRKVDAILAECRYSHFTD